MSKTQAQAVRLIYCGAVGALTLAIANFLNNTLGLISWDYIAGIVSVALWRELEITNTHL